MSEHKEYSALDLSIQSASFSKLRDLSDNAGDIGLVSGVLHGISLTPTLLPNQKDALAKAREAIERIRERNRATIISISEAGIATSGSPEAATK